MHSKNQKRHSSPVPSQSPLVPTKPKALAGTPGTGGDAMTFRVPKDYPHSRFSKAPLAVYPPKGARSKPCVSLPVVSLEKMPCLGRADTTSSQVRLCSSSPSPGDKLANGRCAGGAPSSPPSSSSSSSTDGRPSPVRSPLDRRPDRRPPPSPSRRAGVPPLHTSKPERRAQSGTKPSSTRTRCRLSARVFDPNKHCGVQDPESKRPCTRSLTCKTHSLTHRRAVPGRRKHFDFLLAEHKGRAKDKDEDRDAVKEKEGDATPGKKEVCSQSVASQDTTSPSKPHCPNSRRLSTLKLRFANAHMPRVPGSTSTYLPTAPVPAWTSDPFPHSWSRTPGDSDEGDPEALEDRPAYRYSTRHPRPLACCVFSSRRMGQGHYVFDRRWDRMRLALQDVVEKHLNAQMWRKMPLAAESSSVPSGTSSHLQQPSVSPYPTSVTPSLLSPVPSSSDCLSYTAIFPQSSSVAGVFSVRDAPASACGKPPAAPHKASRASRGREDSLGGVKRRKSTLASPSSVDNLKPNGSRCHLAFQGPGAITAAPAQKNGLGRGDSRLVSRQETWLSSVDGSPSNGTPHMLDMDSVGTNGVSLASRKEPASVAHLSPTRTSGPLVYRGRGGAEGRKRSRPTSYGEAPSKLGRLSGLDSLFRKGNSNGGILAAGLDPPRQAKLHH